MQTSPGSYAVESVNAALASLPLNQVSPILEGPTSLHIVRVEARREAGPATFEELQDQIRRRIMTEKIVEGPDHLPRQAPPRHAHLDHLRRHRERPHRAGGPNKVRPTFSYPTWCTSREDERSRSFSTS